MPLFVFSSQIGFAAWASKLLRKTGISVGNLFNQLPSRIPEKLRDLRRDASAPLSFLILLGVGWFIFFSFPILAKFFSSELEANF